MKITRVEATRIAYPDPIQKRTPPRPGVTRSKTSRTGTPMRLYATGNEITWQMELGFKHFKRFSPYGPEDGIEGINRLEEEIAAARELIGPDSELMLDFWLGLDVETAVRTAERLRPYRLKW